LSTLTKVFTLLVSLLAIFLCGVVVVFVTNSQNCKESYEAKNTELAAAQAHALVVEDKMRSQSIRQESQIERLENSILALEQQNWDLVRQWTAETQARAEAESRTNSAVELSKSLQMSNQDMYAAQNSIQKALEEAHRKMITSQAHVTELTQALNNERVKAAQLEDKRRRSEERNAELENENALIRQRLEKVTLASSEIRPGVDRIRSTVPQEGGVPIRGQIAEIDDNIAAISVGSSSGVRKNMRFNVIRGSKYLGSLVVTHVEATEAAGQLAGLQGAVVVGDTVTTGFN